MMEDETLCWAVGCTRQALEDSEYCRLHGPKVASGKKPVFPVTPAEEWRERFVHAAKKLAVVLGLNNQERSWLREAGFDVPDEEEDSERD